MMEFQSQVSLAPFSWWKIGGEADHLARPKTIEELREALRLAFERGWPVTVLGGASNVLISDRGVGGAVILMRDLCGIERTEVVNGRLEIVVKAGTNKAELTKIFLQNKLDPALFLCGLPGDVGGGVVMNAGVGEMITPREFVEIVDWIEVERFDEGKKQVVTRWFAKKDLHWTYRHTEGWQPGVISRVQVSWPHQPNPEVMGLVRQATRNRNQRQPLEWPSCGSTFRNPPGGKAGALIEQAGLKGYQVGGAQVSEKHANFIINRGGAKADDVMAIIRHVQTTVHDKLGFDLKPEVKFVGRW